MKQNNDREQQLDIQEIGTPTTVGELQRLLNRYSDSCILGFRNRPRQTLYEVHYADSEFFDIVFQPKEEQVLSPAYTRQHLANALLQLAAIQIKYLQMRFQETGSGNGVIMQIEDYLKEEESNG